MRTNRRLPAIIRPAFRRLPVAGAIMSALLGVPAHHALSQVLAGTLPTQGKVVHGTASIRQSGNAMAIHQSSGKLITNWETFNIGAGARVDFLQPSASSMALNRVLSADPSRIYGQLNANGQVFLVNPAGVMFASGSRVNVGGLIASSLDISNADFAAGNFRFSGGAAATGEVVNEGGISTAGKGYAALLGPRVRNTGSIVARLGTVALAAGNAVTLDLHGDSLINLQIDGAAAQALASNSGALRADGGLVVLAAGSTGDPLATVLNNTGTVHATTLANRNGVIRLEGGSSGVVAVSGTLDASGRDAGQTGGTVKVLGDKIGLFDGTRIDVSGDAGGGTALMGGNWQGTGAEQRASASFVGDNAKISADAITAGDGGTVVVWADGSTRFHGEISAQGGASGGDGGMTEVSGKAFLDYNGIARLRAAFGKTGSLLLDPTNISIVAAAPAPAGPTEANNAAGLFTGSGDNSYLLASTLLGQLANSDVTVSTASAGAGAGDITVSAAINYTGGDARTLTLSATRDINIAADITSSSAALNINIHGAAGRVQVGNNTGAAENIRSNGGNIAITGVGRTGATAGVQIQGANIESGKGSITVHGTGSGTGQGVSMTTAATNTIQSTTGAISITGKSAGGSGLGMNSGTNTIKSTGSGPGQGNIAISGTSTASGGFIGVTIGSDGLNTIQSDGGNITVTGSSAGTSSALSIASGAHIIRSTGAGNVTLQGTSSGSGAGLATSAGGNLISVNSGNLSITGTANGTGSGITFGSGTLTVGSSGGDILIEGNTSSAGKAGIALNNLGTNTFINTSGNITLNGNNTSAAADSGSTGIGSAASLSSATSFLIQTGSGNINLTGSSAAGGTAIGLAPGAGTGTITVETTGNGVTTVTGDTVALSDRTTFRTTGSGSLVMQPLADDTTIGLGGAGGTFNLDAAELARLSNGFSSITIGRAPGTGAISVNAATFNDNLVLRQASGGIAFGGALTLGANNLSIASGGGAVTDVQLAGAGNVAITAAGAVSLGNSSISGSLGVETAGEISQSGGSAITVAGATTLAAGSANNIILDGAGNDFGTVSVASGKEVSLRDSNALDMSASSVAGTLGLRSNGAITQSGALTIVGGLNITTDHVAGDVNLNNAGAAATVLGETRVGNNYTLTTGGEISQAGGTVLTIGNNFTVSGGSLSGPAAGNVIGGTDNSAGSGTVIKQVGVVDLSTKDIGSGAGNIAVAGNLSVQSVASAATIAAPVGAGATAVNLGNAGNSIGGPIAITASAPTVTPSGADVATGIIQNGASLSVGGNASFSATTSAANAGGAAGNITLDRKDNSFTGSVSFGGHNVQITSATALAVGSSSATGTLALRAISGNITGSSLLSVAGDASFTADAAGASITLDNAANNFSGSLAFSGAGGLANVTITDSTALDLQALTLTGNLLAKAASMTDSGALSIGGTTGLQATGDVTLDNAGHSFTGAVSVAAANADIRSAGALQIGTGDLSGNLALAANGAITQTGTLAVGGNLALTTTHAAGDVTLDNSAAATTRLGNSSVGGHLSVVATGKNVAQNAGSALFVAGDLSVAAAGVSTNPADNLIGGTDNTMGSGTFIRKVGVVTLGDINTAGDLTVLSLATGQVFDGAAVHGTAVNLANSGNNIAGTVTIQTAGPGIISSGAPVATGIEQSAGTSVQVGGASSFAASGGDVVLANTGNSFGGTVSASGNNVTLRGNGAIQLGAVNAAGQLLVQSTAGLSQTAAGIAVAGTSSFDAGAGAIILNAAANDFSGAVTLVNTKGGISLADANTLTLGSVTAADAVTIAAGGETTLGGDISGTGVSFSGGGAGAVSLAGDVSIDARAGNITLGAMTGGIHDLTLTSGTIELGGNWSGTGTHLLRPSSDATTVGLGGGAGTWSLSAAELAHISSASASQVTIGRTSGTAAVAVSAMTFDDRLALQGGAVTFAAGSHSFGNDLDVTSNGRTQLNGATVTATGGNITINGTGSGSAQGFSMLNSAQLRTTSGSGNISITAGNASGSAFSMGSGTNTIQADGTGNITINAKATGGSGFGVTVGSSGTNTIRVADGNLAMTAASAGSDSSLSLGSGTNLLEATGSGNVTVASTATGGGSGVSMATSGANSMRTASGTLSVTGSATGAGAGITMASGAHTLASTSGNVLLNGTSNGSGNGIGMGTGTNTIEAGGSGNVTIHATSLGASGFGMSIGNSGISTVRVANGALAVHASSSGDDTAISIASGTNNLRATGSGNVAITGTASGAANGVSIGTGGTNNIATTSGNITINGTGAGDGTGISMTSGANAITTGGGNITIDARALGDGDGLAMSSGTNTVAAGGAGNLTINGNAPLGNAVSLGTASKTAGTSTLRVADGVLTVNATAAGSTSALSFGVISGGDPATNTIEATLGGDIIINAVNTGSASGMSMGSSSNNTIRSGAGSIEVNATAAQAAGLAMASGNNAILSGAGGIVLNGTSQGAGNGVSMGTGTNLVAAGGSGNITVNGTAQGATGFGLSMATSGNNTLRVADGILTVRGQSAGEGSAVIMGSGSSTIEATGSGSIDIAGHAAGTGNGFSMGTSGTNTVRTVSGRLDITGKGGDHGINLGSGTNTIQSDSGAVNLAGTALSSGHGFYISSTGRDSVLTNSGDITISGSSATGGAIVIRPTEQQAIIEATGAGNISFRADNYDATPSGTGSARIASAGGVLSIAQLTKGTSIGIGEGAAGLLNWSGAEISQVSGFSLVRVGNSESGALDLRPPWFPFPMQLPPATLSQDELKFNTVRGAAERILSEIMSYGELPPTLAVTRRFSLLIQGFNR